MANVKFNRGILANLSSNTQDALAFLAEDSTQETAKNYGYLYLGSNLVATKYLEKMDVSHYTAGAGLLEIGTSSNSPILTTRSIITTTSSSYDWSNNDNVPTAKVIADFVGKEISGNDIYHKSGTSGAGSDGWNSWTWTADAYKGSTLLSDQTTPLASAYALSFTLPVADTSGSGYDYSTDSTHLTTPAQVATFVAGIAGGMRYIGAIASIEGTSTNSKSGDVYIASNDFEVRGTDTTPAVTVEVDDMIVLNEYYVTGSTLPTPLGYVNTAPSGQTAVWKLNFDRFERNLDGAVTTTDTLTSGKLVVGAGSKNIQTLATTPGGLVYSITPNIIADLSIGSTGQVLTVSSGAPAWQDSIYYLTGQGSTANIITVTRYKNGSVDTSYSETGWTSGVKEITINDVDHATNADKILQTVDNTNATKPLLIGTPNSENPSVTDASYKDVRYSSRINANPNTGEITVNYKTGESTSETVNIVDTLMWHTLQ